MSEPSFGILVSPDELKWIETPGGNSLKVLRVSEETGSWTALFRAAAGTTNPPHIHLGPAGAFSIDRLFIRAQHRAAGAQRGLCRVPCQGCTGPPGERRRPQVGHKF